MKRRFGSQVFSTPILDFEVVFYRSKEVQENVKVYDFHGSDLEFRETGRVGRVVVVNRSNDPYLILGGSCVVGISQDRTFSNPVIVPPVRDYPDGYEVPSFCVEESRALTSGRFAHRGLLPLVLRGIFATDVDQSIVWRISNYYISTIEHVINKLWRVPRRSIGIISPYKSVPMSFKFLIGAFTAHIPRRSPELIKDTQYSHEIIEGIEEICRRLRMLLETLERHTRRGDVEEVEEQDDVVFRWIRGIINLCDFALRVGASYGWNERRLYSVFTDFFGIIRGHGTISDYYSLNESQKIVVNNVINILNHIIRRFTGEGIDYLPRNIKEIEHYEISRVLAGKIIKDPEGFFKEVKDRLSIILKGIEEVRKVKGIDIPEIARGRIDPRAIRGVVLRTLETLERVVRRYRYGPYPEHYYPRIVEAVSRYNIDSRIFGVDSSKIKNADCLVLYRDGKVMYAEKFPQPISENLLRELFNSIIVDIIVYSRYGRVLSGMEALRLNVKRRDIDLAMGYKLRREVTSEGIYVSISRNNRSVYWLKVSHNWMSTLRE